MRLAQSHRRSDHTPIITLFSIALLLCLLSSLPVFVNGGVGSVGVGSSSYGFDSFGSTSQIIAVGDFNSDKHTDIFLLNTIQNKSDAATSTSTSTSSTSVWLIEVWLWNIDSSEFQRDPDSTITSERPIDNVVPGDFNYDGRMDLLLSGPTTDALDRPVHWLRIHLGLLDHFHHESIDLPESVDQILVLDANNDMRLDIFGSRWNEQTIKANTQQHANHTQRGTSESIQKRPSSNPNRRLLQDETETETDGNNDSSDIADSSSGVASLSRTTRTYWLGSSPLLDVDDLDPPMPTFRLEPQDMSSLETGAIGLYSAGGRPFPDLSIPHSHGIVDLDGDCMGDLVVSSEGMIDIGDGTMVKHKLLEIWLNQPERGLVFHSTSILPLGAGQVTFADLDQDGNMDIIVPILASLGGEEDVNEIHIYYNQAKQLCGSMYDRAEYFSTLGSIGRTGCRSLSNLCESDPNFFFDFMSFTPASQSVTKGGTMNTVIYQFPSAAGGGGPYSSWTTPADESNAPATRIPFTMRLADINLDGFPDLLLPILPTPKENVDYGIVELWFNVPCSASGGSDPMVSCSSSAIHRGRRAFSSFGADELNNALGQVRGAFGGATFLDVAGDGQIDIILTTIEPPTVSDTIVTTSTATPSTSLAVGSYASHLFRNNLNEDAYFLQSFASNGVCPAWCPSPLRHFPDPKPYGVNQPGAVFKFAYTDLEGVAHTAIGGQIMQSGYLALSPPYVTFGLGRTNTFIDTFFFGIGLNETTHSRSWVSIVPNAQIIIFPYPHDQPDEWILELFVSPTSHLFWVCISWASVLTLLAIVIGYLHLREKREDEKEKRKHQLLFTF